MKKLNLLFALLLILAACAPAAENPTATASPVPSLTASLSPTPTLTPTDVKSTATTKPTATPERLGGDGVGVAFWYQDGDTSTFVVPPEIASLLVPTSPEKWQEFMNLTDSTGQPLPWGKPVFFVEGGTGDGISPVIPFLVRDIVQYGTHKGENNAPIYFAILETPAKDGSNFYIKQMTPLGLYVNAKYQFNEYPSTGLPIEWLGQNVYVGAIDSISVDSDRLSDTQLLNLLQKNVGKVILVNFPDLPVPVGSYPRYEKMVTWFSDAKLIPKGFEANPANPSFLIPSSP
jgi:hypothetical protein